jgi:murein DD-endopeptidase MepM/ murein hydrolase activator NlpD
VKRFATALAIAAAIAAAGAALAKDSDADAAVRARIARVKAIAERIVIDGSDADWAGIPRFTGSSGRTDDPSRHIVTVAIAPRRDDLLVMLRTAGRPSREDRVFWLDVDFMGASANDFQVGIRSREPHVLWVFEEGRPVRATSIAGIEVAIGEVVEVRIPQAALAKALPAAMAEALRGSSARSWVRVSPFTWDPQTREQVAFGAAVASFRLSLGDEPLDPPLPRAMSAARALPLPLRGQWRVCQGAFGIWTHQGSWAYDFDKVDATLHPSRERNSQDATDYFSWNEPVVAPAPGTVIRSKGSIADNRARTDTTGMLPNEVYLDIGGGVGAWFAHFKYGTSVFAAGTKIAAGHPLGLVGHSGSATWPHLHVGLWRLPEGRETLPMALANVRVGLNPGRDDPWARALERWDIRDGFLVENLSTVP